MFSRDPTGAARHDLPGTHAFDVAVLADDPDPHINGEAPGAWDAPPPGEPARPEPAPPPDDPPPMAIQASGGSGDPVAAHHVPFPFPIPIRTRRVSGRYVTDGGIRLELRVDVDGSRPLKMASGDFHTGSGRSVNYFGSFVVENPKVYVRTTSVVIVGRGRFTWSAGAPNVRITIPRRSWWQPPGEAEIRFFTTSGSPGAVYSCRWQSPYFRTIELEEDRVASVTPFQEYDTGALPSGGPARRLSVPRAYGEAGVEIRVSSAANIVPDAGVGPSWSNAELHHAMEAHFSLYQDVPQWKVWMLTAVLHDLGPGLLGIMFDQQGRHRQGCAVFHSSLAGMSPTQQRRQLYTTVHELGHCCNLFHSFHKAYMNPPEPNRLDALSWMNYPQNYQPASGPGGSGAFWADFPFQFDAQELAHLRHAFQNDLIMGGHAFGTGAALEDPEIFRAPLQDHSGLRLEVRGRDSFLLGEPVVVELKLESTDARGRQVSTNLHPNFGLVQVGIQRPDGSVVAWRPMMEHCISPTIETLTPDRPAAYESAYIGYGRAGHYFQAPGVYHIRAAYQAPDGSRVVSNLFSMRVRSPIKAADDDVAELFMGEEQGRLLYLLGSDSPFLRAGREAFQTVADKFEKHPLAVYAHLVEGVNASREFKRLSPSGSITARAPDYETAEKELTAVVETSMKGTGVDNITLGSSIMLLADAQDALGEDEEALRNAQKMLQHFRRKKVPDFVLGDLAAQVETYQSGEGHLSPSERQERFRTPLQIRA